MQRLDGLIAVRSREIHRALQDFLRFDGQIVDVHIFVSFRFVFRFCVENSANRLPETLIGQFVSPFGQTGGAHVMNCRGEAAGR